MRLNRITDATKIMIFTATIVIVCVLVAVSFKMVNAGKSSIANGTNQFNEMSSNYSDINLSTYNGSSVLGSQVVELINEVSDKKLDLSIRVITNMSTDSYNRVADADYNLSETGVATLTDDITAGSYINPMGQFMGKTYKNKNGTIVVVEFKQQ